MTNTAPLRIELLGRFQVTIDEEQIPAEAWRLRSAGTLVKLLALAPDYRLHREQLMDALWPEAEPEAAANNLRYSLHTARRTLTASAGAAPFLRREGSVLALGPADMVWTDVLGFEEAVAEAWRSAELEPYQRAILLYGGDLLPDDLYEEWLSDRRIALRVSYLTLLTRLAELCEQHGDLPQAVETLQRLVMAEPTQEAFNVQLIRLLALAGQKEHALAQYERLRAILARELDAEPDPITRELVTAIQSGAFPSPVAGQAARPSNLQSASQLRTPSVPSPPSALLGREREIAEVRQQLATTRLLTLTGAGGIGKTRLAIEVARELQNASPRGVAFISLAPVRDPSLVIATIAQALDVREQGGLTLRELVKAHLRARRWLLVLDNFEHLVDAAPLLSELLEACPQLRMLVTSRTRLRLTGEHEYPVPPLAHPASTTLMPVAALQRFPAVALFIRRTREVEPTFQITTENAAAVAEICRRLRGLPLALELAAARGKILPPELMLARLDRPLELLAGGPRNAPERQQTMRNTIRWSYDLLDDDERWLFHRLSVFVGGWTLGAAEAVVDPDDGLARSVLDGLASLVDKSLVVQDGQPDEEPRFGMLEPVREFGIEQLDARGDADEARARHARFFARSSAPTIARLEGPEPRAWLDQLETEHDNLRAALRWTIAVGAAELGQRLAGALWEFWGTRGHLSEGRRWLEAVLQVGGECETVTRAEALRGAGELARRQGAFEDAERLLDGSLALYRRLGEERGIARALSSRGILAAVQGDSAQACLYFEEALALSEHVGDARCTALALQNLGSALAQRGEFRQARQRLEAALSLQRSIGNRIGIAYALTNLGIRAYDDGDCELARTWTEESLALFQSLGDSQRASHLIGNLGQWALAEGDYEQARRRFEESIALCRQLGDKPQVASRLRLLGEVALECGDAPRAARLFGAAEVLRESAGWNAISRGSRERYEQAVLELRAMLDEPTFSEAWAAGRRMTLDEAIDYALSHTDVEYAGTSTGLRHVRRAS